MYPASERNRSGFRAMMEIRTSSAHQAIGLTGLAPQQVWKTPVRPVRDQFCRQPSQPPGKFFSGRGAQAATGMRYSSPRVSNAHSTRAFLLANATAAMLGPRRSLSPTTQQLHESRLLPA
jgi:hypothetical protein